MATAGEPAALSGGCTAAPSQNLAPYGPRTNTGTSPALITGCMTCGPEDGLSRCGACKVVRYCGRDCQRADRPAHRSYCNKIKKARQNLETEEMCLVSGLGEESADIVFRKLRGHFWTIPETQTYMLVRSNFVDLLLRVNTDQAVGCALEHLLEMLQLCQGDPFGMRDLVPALYLRLGRDQDCYDFCKWWATVGFRCIDEFARTELPFIDIVNANVFESAEMFTNKCGILSATAATTLLKIRLLTDLMSLQLAKREAGPRVPQEILDIICKHSVRSVTATHGEVLKAKDYIEPIKAIKKQIRELCEAVNQANKHLWPTLLDPGDNLTARSPRMSDGEDGVMQLRQHLILQYCYNARVETPGAIAVIEALSKK